MSIGNWDPKADVAKPTYTIDLQVLKQFIAISDANLLDQLEQTLTQEEQQQQALLMQLTKEDWFVAAEVLSNDEIQHLIRFFTKAEELPGWEAGAKSPVIWLAKLLKQRGTSINRELLLWIKANSNNQFLPHGALL